MAGPAKLVGLGATICSLSGTTDLMSIIFECQLLIGLGPLLSLLPVWDRDIEGKDRCGDRGCCANDPPSAAVAVLEDRTARTASESSRPSQAAITQIQWPITRRCLRGPRSGTRVDACDGPETS